MWQQPKPDRQQSSACVERPHPLQKARLDISWNAFVTAMCCESVWQYFWRDLTLKGPVKEWQRSRADVIRQETVTRAVVRPKYANCKGQIISTILTDVRARSARTGGRKKNHLNNGHRHKANCRHACMHPVSLDPRSDQHSGTEMPVVCVFTPSVSALGERRLMPDPTPCTSPNSHRLQCSTHPDRMQLFCRAVLVFSHSQRVLHSSCDDPSDCFVSHLAHTFIYHIRQTVRNHYRSLNPVDHVGKVVRSIFQHTSVGLQLTIDRHKHCRRDASWMPSRLSTVLAPSFCNVSQQLRQSVRHTLFNVTRGRSLPYRVSVRICDARS